MNPGPLDRLSVLAFAALVVLALTPWVIAGYGFARLLNA